MGDLHEFISTMRFAWPSQLWPCCNHSSIMCACEPMFALVEFQHVVKEKSKASSQRGAWTQAQEEGEGSCVGANKHDKLWDKLGWWSSCTDRRAARGTRGTRGSRGTRGGEGDGRWVGLWAIRENASVVNEMRQDGDESQRQVGMVEASRCCQLGDWWKLWQCKMHQLKFLAEVGVMWTGGEGDGEGELEEGRWNLEVGDGAWCGWESRSEGRKVPRVVCN